MPAKGWCIPGSWNWFGSCVSMCAYVCVSAPRPLIASGVIWCDWLSKFYGFSVFQVFHMTLAIDKMNGRGLSNSTLWTPANKTKVTRYWPQKERLTAATRCMASVIKMSGQMHSNTYKRRLAISLTVIISA